MSNEERSSKDSNMVRILKETDLRRKPLQREEDLDWRPESTQTPEERGVKWHDPSVEDEVIKTDGTPKFMPWREHSSEISDEAQKFSPEDFQPIIMESFEHIIEYPTSAAAYIFSSLVPEWREQFLEKNAAYGEDPAPLGCGAEFVEIWRKAKKLRRAIWDGEPIGNEAPREVTLDIIGHCFLLLDMLDRGVEDGE